MAAYIRVASHEEIANYQKRRSEKLKEILSNKAQGKNVDKDVEEVLEHYVGAGILNTDGSFAEPYSEIFKG